MDVRLIRDIPRRRSPPPRCRSAPGSHWTAHPPHALLRGGVAPRPPRGHRRWDNLLFFALQQLYFFRGSASIHSTFGSFRSPFLRRLVSLRSSFSSKLVLFETLLISSHKQ